MQSTTFLIFASILCASASGQTASCNFGVRYVGLTMSYSCGLTINNTVGAEITNISGTHLLGYSDADVLAIARVSGQTAIVPRVICSRFPNIQAAAFFGSGLTTVTGSSFGGCRSLAWLELLNNRIASVAADAFLNNTQLDFLDLGQNRLTTLPVTVFAPLASLRSVDIRENPFASIPSGIFANLTELRNVYMQSVGISEVNPHWFSAGNSVRSFYVGGNNLRTVRAGSFATLGTLLILSLIDSNVRSIEVGAFDGLAFVTYLYLERNEIEEIPAGVFDGLARLSTLDLSSNNIRTLTNGSFRSLSSLRELTINSCGVRDIEVGAFEGLSSLGILDANLNSIEYIAPAVFAPLVNLGHLGLRSNRLRVLYRNSFGANVSLIESLDFDANVINAVERQLIEDAARLNMMKFKDNICSSGTFGSFMVNREWYMIVLSQCFSNFENTISTITDNNAQYQFFAANLPGFFARVQAVDTIEIALSPVNGTASQLIEVLIGTANNTLSVIRANQQTNVAIVPSPGIIRSGESNTFRVSWVNGVILAFRENEEFPFLVHTMLEPFDVNFFGLRTRQSRATWIIQSL